MSPGGGAGPVSPTTVDHEWIAIYTSDADLQVVVSRQQESVWRVDLHELCRINQIAVLGAQIELDNVAEFHIHGSVDARNWVLLYTGPLGHSASATQRASTARAHAFDDSVVVRFLSVEATDGSALPIERIDVTGSSLLPNSRTMSDPSGGPCGRDLEPPALGGVAVLQFTNVSCASQFGFGLQHERIEIFPVLEPPPQLPLRMSITPPPTLAEEHGMYATPPAVFAYVIRGASLWGYGLQTLGNRFVWLEDCMPGYFRDRIRADGHDFPSAVVDPVRWRKMQQIIIDRPVASPIHPNMVYGHFLLEILPKFYILATMKQLGMRFSVALPRDILAWIKPFVKLYFDESDLIWYDIEREIIVAPALVQVSMMHVNYNFNAAVNLLVTDLRSRVGLPVNAGQSTRYASSSRHIYISRRRIDSHKRLLNEAEIEATMTALGFTIVHPQTMSLRDQLQLFGEAEIVVGEYSSALHNTLFSPPGTHVISIDFFSWYQSAIGRLRQQPIYFVAPDDGVFRHWRQTAPYERTYSVDPDHLRGVVLEVMQHVRDNPRRCSKTAAITGNIG